MWWTNWPSRVGALCVVLAAAAPTIAQQKKVLMLVANRDNLINLDPALKLHLEWVHAAEVTVEQADAFDTVGLDELAQEHSLVLISESLGSGSVLENGEFKLQNTPVPVMSFEAYMWEDAFWSELPQFDKFGNTGRTDLIDSALAAGLDAPQTDLFITATGAQHAMGAGFPEGAVTIHTLPYSVNFGTPSADAKVIATADAAGEFPSHFVYETGDTLVDGSSVPAARIGLFVGQAANPNANFAPLPEFFNDAAWDLLDAAFEFTLGPRPTPGDVNMDGVIDLADFSMIADEFMTEGMTRADVNHDMKVDFADFGLWKVNFLAGAESPAFVPEPVSLSLLALGSLVLLAWRPFGRVRRSAMKTHPLLQNMAIVCAVLAGVGQASAEDVNWLRTAADGPTTWNDDANWMTASGDNFAPDGSFEDFAVINNGGWAFLEEPAVSNDVPLAGVDVGRDINTGTLEIRGDGALKTNGLNVAGAESSTLILSGNANLEVSGDASTLRNTRIVGPEVSFSVTSDYQVSGIFQPVITADAHSAVQVGGATNIDSAVLRPEFDGVTPAIGSSWPLIDADTVAGSFQLDASLAPQLDAGLIYASAVNAAEGDVNLIVTNTLDLVVNRRSGQASIRNVVGDPISLDRYSITSESGRLSPTGWLSFADSGSAGDGWVEGTVDSQILTESKASGPSSIEVGTPISIGTPVVPENFAAEDLEFTFSAGGLAIPGLVTYEGIPLNLVLNVDPATGSGEIINQATVDITFDGYSVGSPSGALRPEDGAWTSLEDNGSGGDGWTEANPTETFLSELNPEGTTTLAPNQSLSLGSLFDVNGASDLTFQYFLAGSSPDLRDGFVAYGLLPNLPGDCNGDGLVNITDANCTSDDQLDAFLGSLSPPSLRGDADGDGQVQFTDLVVLSDNFGSPGEYTDADFDKDGTVQFGDLVILSDRFGQSGGTAVAATAAVPEPSTLMLLAISLAAGFMLRTRS